MQIFGGGRVPPRMIAKILGQMVGPHGSFAVLGNHDFSYGATEIASVLTKQGIVVLDDEHRSITVEGHSIDIVGIPDARVERDSSKRLLAGLLPGRPTIVLAHDPGMVCARTSRPAFDTRWAHAWWSGQTAWNRNCTKCEQGAVALEPWAGQRKRAVPLCDEWHRHEYVAVALASSPRIRCDGCHRRLTGPAHRGVGLRSQAHRSSSCDQEIYKRKCKADGGACRSLRKVDVQTDFCRMQPHCDRVGLRNALCTETARLNLSGQGSPQAGQQEVPGQGPACPQDLQRNAPERKRGVPLAFVRSRVMRDLASLTHPRSLGSIVSLMQQLVRIETPGLTQGLPPESWSH